jgi:hypothetical protein
MNEPAVVLYPHPTPRIARRTRSIAPSAMFGGGGVHIGGVVRLPAD